MRKNDGVRAPLSADSSKLQPGPALRMRQLGKIDSVNPWRKGVVLVMH